MNQKNDQNIKQNPSKNNPKQQRKPNFKRKKQHTKEQNQPQGKFFKQFETNQEVPEQSQETQDFQQPKNKFFSNVKKRVQQNTIESTNKNQPKINHINYQSVFKSDFVQRNKSIFDKVVQENLVSPSIYGNVMYDISAIHDIFKKVSLQMSTKDAISMTFSQKQNLSHLILSSALMNLAIQIQSTMTQNQVNQDFFRSAINDPPKTHKLFKQLIHTYGGFKCEQGKINVKYANLQVAQLYHMALSNVLNVEQAFLDKFKFEPSQWMRQLQTPELYSRAVFRQMPFEKDDYVISQAKHVWKTLSENNIFDGTLGKETFLPFEHLTKPGGRQWALLHGEHQGISISQLMYNLQRGLSYDGQLNNIDLQVFDIDAVELINEVRKLKTLLEHALNDTNHQDLVKFNPCSQDEVNGRWQMVVTDYSNQNQMTSYQIVTKEDVQYAFVQKTVKVFQVYAPLTLTQSRPYDEMIQIGYSEDLKNR